MTEPAVAGETSRAARAAVAEAVGRIPADQVDATAGELAAVADLLHSNLTLRNAVADPATPASVKSTLVRRVLAGKVGEPTLAVLDVASAQRWSVTRDLVDTLDRASTVAVLTGAANAGQLSEAEDELFRFGRILAREPELNLALTDPAVPTAAKERLVGSLLQGKATETTIRLATRAVTSARGVPLERALADVAALASARRQQLLAVVRSATTLDADRVSRLEASLRRIYGRDVHVQVEIDSSLIGGLTIRVGDEVVDGSIRHRIAQARARFA